MRAPRRMARESFRAALACAVLCAACSELPSKLPEALCAADPGPQLLQGRHAGPPVVAAPTGPARFVAPLYEQFDLSRALDCVRFVDGFYRAPANDGYAASLEHVAARLRAAGFGGEAGFELTTIETQLTARAPNSSELVLASAWTPLDARIAMIGADGVERVLHAFETPEGRDRVMLPVNAPSCAIEGGIAFSLDELEPGELLVIEAAPLRTVLTRAETLGAVAVLSANIESYNADPSGQFRHLDAVQYRQLPAGQSLPVGMISPRSLEALKKAHDVDAKLRVRFAARVKFDVRPLRTLCATIVGTDRAAEAVVTVSHVQEPGANDNASGVGGMCESACALSRALHAGAIKRPSRSLVFLWGDEFRQSSAWLGATKLRAVAALSSDMTGESLEKTGARALLERMPDPGALEVFAPDAHTPWGKAQVDEAQFAPNGVALIARCALLDVAAHDAAHDAAQGGWETAEHPFEGGSDHDVFIEHGVPAALFWHFTDFAYHTGLDRMENVDVTEIRRTGVALMATALALADPLPEDLDRYLRSLNEEERLRASAAESGGAPLVAESWRRWCAGARQWLRIECLRIPENELKPTK